MTDGVGWRKATSFWQSCKHALLGLRHVLYNERNFRIQLVLGLGVVLFAMLINVGLVEFAILLITVLMVLTMEIVNTAFEMLADIVEPKNHDKIGILKDVTAGAVLAVSVGAIVIGVVIFIPRLVVIFAPA